LVVTQPSLPVLKEPTTLWNQTPAFWSLRCSEGTGLCCPLSPVDPCGARTRHSSSNTASSTTANPQANSRGRAGPGYCASIQNDLNNCASLRGTAVPAVITGGTPVPQFMSLCIVQFLPALRFGVDVEGVKTPIPVQSLVFVSRRTPRNHEMSFRAERGTPLSHSESLALPTRDIPQCLNATTLAFAAFCLLRAPVRREFAF